jgi:tetratricopeptide (TPR) repeat protein
MDYLHNYYDAAAVFHDYLTNEEKPDPSAVARVREAYGDALAALGPHEAALKQYERALPDSPDRPRLYLKIADTYRRNGDYAKARATIQRLLNSHPYHLQALRDMAEICLQQADTASAHAYAAQALRILMEARRPGIAYSHFSEGMLGDLHAILGLCLVFQSRYEDAQILANQALSENPRCYRAYNVFGLMHLHQGHISRAMRSFGVSLRLKPDQPEIQHWLEEALEQKSRRKELT